MLRLVGRQPARLAVAQVIYPKYVEQELEKAKERQKYKSASEAKDLAREFKRRQVPLFTPAGAMRGNRR